MQAESQNIDQLHASGDIMNGNLVPEAPTEPKAEEKPQAITEEVDFELPESLSQYKTKDEAAKGYWHLLKLAREAQNERDQLKERLAAVNQSSPPVQPATTPPPSPKAHPSAVHDWMKTDAVAKLAEQGIDAQALAEFAQTVIDEADKRSEAKVDGRLTPLINQAQAQNDFYAHNPEAIPLQAEIDAYVAGLPEEDKDVIRTMGQNGQYKQAMRFVLKGFKAERQALTQTQLQSEAQAAEKGRKSQRAAAALPQSSPSTPIHAANDDTPDPKMMEELAERARNHDPEAQRAYRKLTFGRKLPAKWFTGES